MARLRPIRQPDPCCLAADSPSAYPATEFPHHKEYPMSTFLALSSPPPWHLSSRSPRSGPGRHRPHLHHQQRRRQHPRHRPRDQQGRAGDQGHSRRPRHRLLAGRPKVYVSNEADTTLDVIDRKTGKLIKKIELSDHPNNIAVSKDGRKVVVAHRPRPGRARHHRYRDADQEPRASRSNGPLHNVYMTPDSKYVVGGSIRSKSAHRRRSAKRKSPSGNSNSTRASAR